MDFCCCSSWCSKGEDEAKPLENGAIDGGPAKNRGCTDIFCIPILLVAQLVFLVVTVIGLADGNPEKLYKPRDYRGSYCGVSENWNNGGDKTVAPVLSYTMNVTSTVDQLMKEFVCSTKAKTALVDGSSGIASILSTQEEKDDYLCNCCLAPCAKCEGSLDKGSDLVTDAAVSAFSKKMGPLTDLAGGASLFDPTGANGDTFSSTAFWQEATKYFNQVCLPSCDTNYGTINASSLTARSYTYKPMRDDPLYSPWEALLDATDTSLTSTLRTVIRDAFTFSAFPETVCPYEASLCVPFPGMVFAELASGADYCTLEMAAEVVNMVGDAAATAFTSLGFSAFAEASTETFGKWAGDFLKTMDTFIVVSLLSFVVGVVFLVVLRFTIGVCVWIAVACTVLFFAFGGAFMFVLSGQCQGAGLFDTGHQVAVAVVVAGSHAVQNALSGTDAPSEYMAPGLNGTDYRGGQRHTRRGKTCLDWDSQDVLPIYNSTNYPDAALSRSLCRNPSSPTDANIAKTIWCVTSDVNYPWQECLPIGVIQPECTHGYEISGQNMRDALYYSSFVIWASGGIWIILILCFVGRIRLAIALNKVAAIFLAGHPHILLLPIVQGILGILWCMAWMAAASFLLSQVPDGYTPKGYYATYAEAYGTGGSCAFWEFGDQCSGTPGACTDQWPTGSVWKTNDCEVSADGDIKCFRCAPPRYVFDLRFAISFFVFLWNNAFNIALGQIIIAMVVCTWFFLPKDRKGEPIILQSIKTVFRYHVGSVAFGSFIVAVVQFIRYLMRYFEKQAAAQKNRILVLVLKIVQCCIWCFERCVKFLNKNAYIQTALHGTNFCTSARKAFFLILRNALRFGVIATLSNVIHMIGFVCITVATGVIGYFMCRAMHPDISPFLPLFCMMFMAYNVASLFMGVFGLAVDASLQCFIACEELKLSGDFVPECLDSFIKCEKEKAEKAAKA